MGLDGRRAPSRGREDAETEMQPCMAESPCGRSTQTSLFETSNVRPMRFGAVDGFRFDISKYVRRSDEVGRAGFVAGAVRAANCT